MIFITLRIYHFTIESFIMDSSMWWQNTKCAGLSFLWCYSELQIGQYLLIVYNLKYSIKGKIILERNYLWKNNNFGQMNKNVVTPIVW